jgi:hypothetical protein
VIPGGCKVLQAYSVSHGKASSYLPVIELLQSYFNFADSDDGETRRAKVRQSILALDPALSDTIRYLFALLGLEQAEGPLAQMDAQLRRRRRCRRLRKLFYAKPNGSHWSRYSRTCTGSTKRLRHC